MNQLNGRRNGVYMFFGLLLFILLLKLFQLQVLQNNYDTESKSVAVVEEEVFPSRGLIYDRNKNLIVYNAPVYDIYFSLSDLEMEDTAAIAEFLQIDHSIIENKITEAREKKFYRKPYPLLKRLSEKDYAVLQEDLYRFPALSVKISTERRYRYPNAAMVLGYMGEVNSAEIEHSEGYYSLGENIGKTGIEHSFEDSLKGIKGKKYLLRDKNNVIQGPFKSGEYDVSAEPGKDLITTIDIDLQQYAEQLMNGKVGSVVALEPSSGEILTMVSSPTYDPNWLTGRQRNSYFKALLVDSLKPMFNRAVSAEYPPGSTFKPLASLIGLQVGAVTENFTYPCGGGYNRNRGKPGCHAHSKLTGVQDAIKQSCNAYYAENLRLTLTADRYANIDEALNDWRNYLTFFGYTKKFDIGIGGVKSGFFPTAEYYDKVHQSEIHDSKHWHWGPMTVISLSIGQGETLATTLQMAQSTAVIANRGTSVDPHLVKSFSENQVETNTVQAPIDQEHFENVVEGMYLTFEEGTARGSRIDSLQACGKTGTAENPHGDDHSLFIAFAPKDNPEIAIAVIIENGGYGSTYAAPIASLLMEKYIKDSIPENRKWMEKRMLEANLVGFDRSNYLEYVDSQQMRIKQRLLLQTTTDSEKVSAE